MLGKPGRAGFSVGSTWYDTHRESTGLLAVSAFWHAAHRGTAAPPRRRTAVCIKARGRRAGARTQGLQRLQPGPVGGRAQVPELVPRQDQRVAHVPIRQQLRRLLCRMLVQVRCGPVPPCQARTVQPPLEQLTSPTRPVVVPLRKSLMPDRSDIEFYACFERAVVWDIGPSPNLLMNLCRAAVQHESRRRRARTKHHF